MVSWAVGVLTYNSLSTLRFGLLRETISSLLKLEPDRLFVLDNGSTDGSDRAVEGLTGLASGWPRCRVEILLERPDDGNTSPGRGRNRLMEAITEARTDLVILSDDDVCWRPEAKRVLESLWDQAPADLQLVAGLLEPNSIHNQVRHALESYSVRALVRDSAPAAAWCFPVDNWARIGPLHERVDGDGEDYEACGKIIDAGGRVAQLDVATHIGEGYSLLGNDPARLKGRPLDRERWGI